MGVLSLRTGIWFEQGDPPDYHIFQGQRRGILKGTLAEVTVYAYLDANCSYHVLCLKDRPIVKGLCFNIISRKEEKGDFPETRHFFKSPGIWNQAKLDWLFSPRGRDVLPMILVPTHRKSIWSCIYLLMVESQLSAEGEFNYIFDSCG